MWALENRTPYAAEKNWIRDRNGAQHWLVAVKATFDVAADGTLKLADEQPPPALAPEHRGDPAKTSLRVDSDLLEVKPATDVVVDAAAHAPQGRPAATVPVALRVGSLEKTLVVHGTRVYYGGVGGLTTSPPRPFVTQPITYEWAYGGYDATGDDPRRHRLDPRNPVGRGVTADPARLEHQPAHAVEYPGSDPARRGPAGFGPVDRGWAPRYLLAGTYDARWEKTKKPLLPDDYDDRYALCAPEDQRLGKPLHGGETVALVNMTPEGVMKFDLPKIALGFVTRFGPRSEEHPRALLATVFVDALARKLSLVWQTALRVPGREVDYLDATVIREKRYLR